MDLRIKVFSIFLGGILTLPLHADPLPFSGVFEIKTVECDGTPVKSSVSLGLMAVDETGKGNAVRQYKESDHSCTAIADLSIQFRRPGSVSIKTGLYHYSGDLIWCFSHDEKESEEINEYRVEGDWLTLTLRNVSGCKNYSTFLKKR